MAQNYIQAGDVLPYVVPESETVTSGDPVVIGRTVGVALGSGTEDQTVQVSITGVYRLPKAAGAVEQGEALYLDEAEAELTTTSAGNIFAGFAAAEAANLDPTVDVKLSGGAAATVLIENQADVATADGSDPATTQALANALKVAHNALLAKLKAAGIMEAD